MTKNIINNTKNTKNTKKYYKNTKKNIFLFNYIKII